MKNRFDVVENLEQFTSSERFLDLDRNFAHQRYLKMTLSGEKVPEEKIQYLHDRILAYYGATAASAEQFEQERRVINGEIWPMTAAKLATNAGLYAFLFEHATYSRYVLPFAYDIWTNTALAFMIGFGLSRSVLDEMEVLPSYDPARVFFLDQTFGSARHRSKQMQPDMKKAQNILMLGGGVDPALFTRGYPLGENGQRIVIYDRNPEMPRYLEQILGAPLVTFGIDYRIGDVLEALKDENLQGQFDVVQASGLVCYFHADPKPLFDGIRNALRPGGQVLFDATIMNPIFAFVLKALEWPEVFHVEATVESAVKAAEQYCAGSGLVLERNVPEAAAAPAGVVFWGRKPE